MVRRRGENNDVRGPTSALTSFLKEKGIRARGIRNGFSRQIDEEQQEQPVAGPSGTSTPGGANTTAASSPAPGGIVSLGNSGDESESVATPAHEISIEMQIEGEDDEEAVSPRKNRKQVLMKKRKKVADSDDEEEFEPVVPPKARYADRKPGSFAMCAECNKKFTITRYTNTHPEIPGGVLCGPCDKEMGPAAAAGGIGKKVAQPAGAAKKRARAVKGKGITTEKAPLTSLTKCCIDVIAKAITDVEEFGEISHVNKDKVCQIVCKNRDLTLETAQLFLGAGITALRLYDCTRLEPEGLRVLANHCPNLETLTLFMCGFMDDETILHYAQRLTKLKHLELYAAFLVRKAAWNEFFSILQADKRTLDAFMIRQSPRIDNSVVTSLVETCGNLTRLQLAECGSLNDTSLALLHPLKHLTYLDLSKGGLKGETYTDDGIVPLLENVGGNLLTLILDDNLLLTDRTLIEGIKVNCTELIELSMKLVGEILPTGIAELFSDDWINQKGMVRLSLNRCIQLDDQAIEAILAHSGNTLLKLDLNSVDKISEKGLKALAEKLPNVTDLDVSFIREVDDFALKALLDGLPSLQRIYIYGNNRVSDLCPTKVGVKILGHEQGMVQFE